MRYRAPLALWMVVSLLFCLGRPRARFMPPSRGPHRPVEPPAPAVSTSALPDEPQIRPMPEESNIPEVPPRVCPATRYVNCMPPVPQERRSMCSSNYVKWIKEHCPGVEVTY